MKIENKMVLQLITKSVLKDFNKDYYHMSKYDNPKVDVYDLSTQEGSLLANMEQSERCANVISIYWNVLGDAKDIKHKSESLSFIISPTAKNIIDTFDFNNVVSLEHELESFKFKSIYRNNDWIVLDDKRYHTNKRSTHHLVVKRIDGKISNEEAIRLALVS